MSNAGGTVVPIEQSQQHVFLLQSLVFAPSTLRKKGYVMDPLTPEELDRKKRCGRCQKALSRRNRDFPAAVTDSNDNGTSASSQAPPLQGVTSPEPGTPLADCKEMEEEIAGILEYMDGPKQAKPPAQPPKKPPQPRCRYHPGKVQYRAWTCCQGGIGAAPCCQDEDHVPYEYVKGELEANWLFYHTPQPGPRSRKKYAVAVAIDCEMGVSEMGESELIRLSVIDYFSGATLVDSLVWPDIKMKHWNTRFSGITAKDMHDARRRRTCLLGRNSARKAVWRCVGPDTVLIGHGLNSDLLSLRWIHPHIIDTMLIEEGIVRTAKAGLPEDPEQELTDKQKELAKIAKTPLGLKGLSSERLGRTIQVKGQGHDSVEDAVASRDLLNWHIVNRVANNIPPTSF